MAPHYSAFRHLREDAGLTVVELAARACISERSVFAYEAGQTSPSLRAAVRIADVLGCSVDELADRRTNKTT